MVNPIKIKSFKHNGSVHRIWMENWHVPSEDLCNEHAALQMYVFVSNQTPILEADGKEWVSRVPSVSFFIPGEWYNIVALIEPAGIRYYCNIASPVYWNSDTLTYIDYDLDVIVLPDRSYTVVDKDEYEVHQQIYHYSAIVREKVEAGLDTLLQRIEAGAQPFDDEAVYAYLDMWKRNGVRGAE